MYKVFYNGRVIHLMNNDHRAIQPGRNIYIYRNKKKLCKLLHSFYHEDMPELFILHHNPGKLLEKVKSCYRFIEAGGGLVRNTAGHVLVIKRRGKWDLPKGKAGKDEKIREAALREVKEECGLHDLQSTGRLTTTFHVYMDKGQSCLKRTSWYTMITGDLSGGTPQSSEEITEIKWLRPYELPSILDNTYPAVVDVLKAGGLL